MIIMLRTVEDTIINCIKVGMSYCRGEAALLQDNNEYYLVDLINDEPYLLKDTDFEKIPIINAKDINKYDINIERCCNKLDIKLIAQQEKYKNDNTEIEFN